jgi:hypothetical protein
VTTSLNKSLHHILCVMCDNIVAGMGLGSDGVVSWVIYTCRNIVAVSKLAVSCTAVLKFVGPKIKSCLFPLYRPTRQNGATRDILLAD